jgi:glutamate dehydrogenase (NADP+)
LISNSYDEFMRYVSAKNVGQTQYLQSVASVMESVWPMLEANPRYRDNGLLERMVEPERIVMFRVSWVDDRGNVNVNRGFRVQHSSVIGPYKGGLRFHPSLDLHILKSLAFEQSFKNALTGIPLGGGKGGSDFDPKGRSDGEVMRFCHAFVQELYRHIGSDTDIPAGDIGVGAREVGFMTGMLKKLTNKSDCVFTGKGLSYGGSLLRQEATGYGAVYFAQMMLKNLNLEMDGLRVGVSGSGNVAQFAIQKAMRLGAKVVTVSDSNGTVVDEQGFNEDKLNQLIVIKIQRRGRISEYADAVGAKYFEGTRPWACPVDVAIPCATENELDENDARQLMANGVRCVAEGANMPVTFNAVKLFEENQVAYAPGKATNAGGVATSGLEMSQNAMHSSWPIEQVDATLQKIMTSIHDRCIEHGSHQNGWVNYRLGANRAGFIRLAEAMIAQGVI